MDMDPPPPPPTRVSNAVLVGRIIGGLENLHPPKESSNISNVPAFNTAGQEYLKKLLSSYLETIEYMKGKLEAGEVAAREKVEAIEQAGREKMEDVKQAGREKVEVVEQAWREKVEALNIKLATLEANAEATDQISGLVGSFKLTMDRFTHPKPGSVTRSQAWEKFASENHVNFDKTIPKSTSPAREALHSALTTLAAKKYDDELKMYPGIVKTIQNELYPSKSFQVVDTHKRHDLPVDIMVARFDDGRVAYTQRYWFEIKMKETVLATTSVRGQMLDNLRDSVTFQPQKVEVIGILSNLSETWVFMATTTSDGFQLTVSPAPSFADAILFAHERTERHQDKLPDPAARFRGRMDVLSATREHYLYSASAMDGAKSRVVVVKVATDSTKHNLENEIRHLRELSETGHPNIAKYFWSSDDSSQLAITPKGRAITTGEPASVSRSLIEGLITGLEWLHDQRKIVHRDIRLSNVIIHKVNTPVIIDFQTAAYLDAEKDIIFLGGRICWPRRLLSSGADIPYRPIAQDDLHAAILFVMHLLFPAQFNAFGMHNVMNHEPSGPRTKETDALVNLWEDMDKSTLLSPFVAAAVDCNYEELRKMASLFCSPEVKHIK